MTRPWDWGNKEEEEIISLPDFYLRGERQVQDWP